MGAVRVDLPDGRSLTVRPVVTADLDALAAMYESLSVADRRFRFFTGTAPTRRVLEHFVEANHRGGLWLVAVTDDGAVVADGGYVTLDDGDGEFAITVTQPWRGWLGPHLLDVLFQHAAAHGLENLHAEILRNNRRMLALMERRGYASFDQPDCTIASVTVSATGGRPSWPPEHARRRLLVEGCAGHWAQAGAARAAGWDVVTCSGPGERSVPMCPLVEGEPCPLVEGADLVIVAPPRADARFDELLAGHERSSSVQPLIAADLDEASLTRLLGAGADLGQDAIVHGEAGGAQRGADRAPDPH